jgi:hypothetical protein
METMKVMVGGKEMELTHHEMKHIADKYWEEWGKKSMLKFSEKMKNKAAGNIADALAMFRKPESEDEIKHAIAHALFIASDSGDWDLLAEVLYEASEFAAASFSVYSVEEPEDEK